MNILVDYDNIPRMHRDKGILYVMDKILQSLGSPAFNRNDRTHVKLYGGWYEDSTFSRRAQDLTVDIQSHFPRHMMIQDSVGNVTTRVDVELALALEIEPAKHLWYTYRRRRVTSGIRCRHPRDIGCAEPACPLLAVFAILDKGRCPNPQCTVSLEQALFKDEQKLVDSMLSADLIHMAQRGDARVCLVTSDDDFWPAIRTALLLGSRVTHVHTLTGRTTPAYYCDSAGPSYEQLTI